MFEQLKYNLKHNRKSVLRTTAAWVFFGIIIAVFILSSNNMQDPNTAQGGAAAHVNGSTISLAEYNETLERMRRDPRFEQLQALGGDAGRQILGQQAMDQLIQMELIEQATQKQDIVATDAEVRDVITAIPQFQENGQFQRALYLGYLNAVRKTPTDFENEIRREQALRRTVRLFGSALGPMPLLADKMKTLSSIKSNLDFVRVLTETLVPPSSVKEADVKAFLAQSDSEKRIKDYFDSHKQEFSTPEQVKARHILVRIDPNDTDSEKKAEAKIKDLAEKAKTQDFAKLATQNSDDPGSKSNGGLLDFFSRGRMVPEFEDVAFTTPPGQISAPVKTQYGFHLIQVLEKRPAKEANLDQQRNEIAAKLIAADRAKAAIENLQAALQKGDSAVVQKFVSENGLKWEETGVFGLETDQIPKLGANDEIINLGFSLTPEKPLADRLVREGSTAYIVRYKPVPASVANKPSEQSPEMMAELLANRRAEDSLKTWVDNLRKTADISINQEVYGRN